MPLSLLSPAMAIPLWQKLKTDFTFCASCSIDWKRPLRPQVKSTQTLAVVPAGRSNRTKLEKYSDTRFLSNLCLVSHSLLVARIFGFVKVLDAFCYMDLSKNNKISTLVEASALN